MSVQPMVKSANMTGQQHIEMVERYAAHNYHPLPVVVAKADGVWVEDADGARYMDMLAAYSACRLDVLCGSFGLARHNHQPESIDVHSNRDHVRSQKYVNRPLLITRELHVQLL